MQQWSIPTTEPFSNAPERDGRRPARADSISLPISPISPGRRVGGVRSVSMAFLDRSDAGRALAPRLEHLRGTDCVVLALPRGGIPVAREIARELGLPLDVVVVRKLGVPGQPELAMGAIGEGGVRVVNDDIVRACAVGRDDLDEVCAVETAELERRAVMLREGRRPAGMMRVVDRIALIVDDGMATGATVLAATGVVRAAGASWVVVAVPVASREAVERVGAVADEVVCGDVRVELRGVGEAYVDFHQLTDVEAVEALHS